MYKSLSAFKGKNNLMKSIKYVYNFVAYVDLFKDFLFSPEADDAFPTQEGSVQKEIYDRANQLVIKANALMDETMELFEQITID